MTILGWLTICCGCTALLTPATCTRFPFKLITIKIMIFGKMHSYVYHTCLEFIQYTWFLTTNQWCLEYQIYSYFCCITEIHFNILFFIYFYIPFFYGTQNRDKIATFLLMLLMLIFNKVFFLKFFSIIRSLTSRLMNYLVLVNGWLSLCSRLVQKCLAVRCLN